MRKLGTGDLHEVPTRVKVVALQAGGFPHEPRAGPEAVIRLVEDGLADVLAQR